MARTRFPHAPSIKEILVTALILALTVINTAGAPFLVATPQTQQPQRFSVSSGQERLINQTKPEATKTFPAHPNPEPLNKLGEPGESKIMPSTSDQKPLTTQDQPQETKAAQATDAVIPNGVEALPNLT